MVTKLEHCEEVLIKQQLSLFVTSKNTPPARKKKNKKYVIIAVSTCFSDFGVTFLLQFPF